MKKKYLLYGLTISLVFCLSMLVNNFPVTKAASNNALYSMNKSINVTFTSGNKVNAFNDKTITLNANSTNGYVTMPETFAKTVTMNDGSYFKKVDDETFYFNEGDYSYTFTGWKIKDSTTYIPMNTVFQPNDIIDIETLNVNGNYEVTLEAVWGRVIYLSNEYSGRYYTDYWIYDKEKTTDGTYTRLNSWNYKYENNTLILNKGKDVDNPVSSLDYAYYVFNKEKDSNYLNAYLNVIMLTNDYDYVKSSTVASGQPNYFTSYDIYNMPFEDKGDYYSVVDENYDINKRYYWGEYTAQRNRWGYLTAGNWLAVTFKSVGNTNYNLYWNAFGYSDAMPGNIRFDNVNFGAPPNNTEKRPMASTPSIVSSETSFSGGEGNYIEFTNRNLTTGNGSYVLRPGAIQTVVVNGGTFSSWQTSWSSDIDVSYNISWYMGSTANITGDITLGTTAVYSTTVTHINVNEFKFTMTGGTLYGNIYGNSNVSSDVSHGNRIINIIGDRGTDSKSNPIIRGNIYGGGKQSSIVGNSYINIYGCTNLIPTRAGNGNVYGGGYFFNATLYGTANVRISNSTINGDVFGGGYNGNIDEDSSNNGGYINLNITNSEVTGNVFGVGMGGSQSTEQSVTFQAENNRYNWKEEHLSPLDSSFNYIKNIDYGDYDTDWSWNKPAYGFPFLVTNENSKDFGYLCSSIIKYVSWTSNSSDYISFGRTRTFNFMSLAFAKKDVHIEINGSTIGINSTNGKGNVYGGGSLAVVHGNVDIDLIDSLIYGTVYGGGDGTSKPSKVVLYEPFAEEGYVAPDYTYNANGTVSYQSEKVKNLKSLGSFTWSNDSTVLDKGGIDYDRKLIYSENANPLLLGKIYGSISLNISGTTVYGNIFGGGNAGTVDNGTLLILDNVTAYKNIYGGGNQASVYGDTYLNIKKSKVGVSGDGSIFGGGNAAGVIKNATETGSTKVIVEDTNVKGSIYGGNNEKGELSGNSVVYISGTTEVLKDVYGGGNKADIGTVDNNNSKSTINITGALINGDVYGGSNQSVVYGNTVVNIGNISSSETLKAGDIIIKGSVFGGGKSSSAGTDTYDFSYIAVKNGTTLNIDGNGYNTFNIEGSIFGSGNASSSEGDSIININNYGSKSDIKQNVSIQRANKVVIDKSFIELSGATDRTNEFKAELFSISRVDDLILKNGTNLYFQNGTNLLKKLESLDVNDTPVSKESVINRLYVMPGKNVKITTSEDASSYGEVSGMTFLGMYNKDSSNNFIYGIYNESYNEGDTILEQDKNAYEEGTYVLAFHSNDYNVNGFVSNFEDETTGLLSYHVINPTPTDQDYHFWKIGGDKEVINITLTASKYSILGKHNSIKLQSAEPNTVFSITSVSTSGFNGNLVDPNTIPEFYANSDDANNIMGLKMKIGGSEWESDKEYYFLSSNGGEASSNSTFKTSNATSAPLIEFYLNNASNISKDLDKGVITIKLSSEHRISGSLQIEQKEIIIKISINTLVYEELDYEGHITSGRQSGVFGTSSVNITQNSSLSVYFSAHGHNTNNPYVGTYHRSLISSMVLPAGTKIIMSDISDSKIVNQSSSNNPTSYYYIVTDSDYNNNVNTYRLDKFIKMGTYNSNEHYDDKTNYYNNNYVAEDFIFVVDFEDCINKPSIGNGYTIYIENKNDLGDDIINANGSTIQSVNYNVVEDTDSFSIDSLTLDKESYYPNDKVRMNIEISSKDKTIDTTLQNKSFILGVTFLKEDSDGIYKEVNISEVMGTKFIVNNNTYNLNANGTANFVIFDNIVDIRKTVVIDYQNSKLSSGNYKIKVDAFTNSLPNYTNNIVASATTNVLTIKDAKFGLDISMDNQDRIIKNNGITMNGNNKLVVNTKYSSNLSNPNLRIMITNKEGYINLSNFITDEVKVNDEGYSYRLINNLSNNMDIVLNLTNSLESGSYYLVFMLYDDNNYIGETKLNIVVKK